MTGKNLGHNWARLHAAGNLKYDGQFVYQYDAWNRLCQVTLPQANAPPGTPGTLVKHYLYDGVGRLIRVQSPYPDPLSAQSTNKVRSERIFYDGVRRVQELVTDPINDTQSAAAQGNTGAQQTLSGQSGANQNSSSAGAESGQVGAPGSGLPSGLSLAREYVWGPGDRGIDELLCQYGPTRLPSYPLHDGGGDIIALVDKNGPGVGGSPRLLWQATYDAYGQVVEEQTLVAAHTYLHAGHKGLFFDRLDSSIVDPVTFQEIPRLMPANHAGSGGGGGARLIGYARNRYLHTGFGRWLQRDPNATGLSIVGQQAMHGERIVPRVLVFELMDLLVDGSNIYELGQSSGFGMCDSLGLYSNEDFLRDLMAYAGMFDPIPGPSDFIRESLQAMVNAYSANLEWDVEWATDWSMSDDAHTRNDNSWVEWSLAYGLKSAFTIDLPFGYEYNPIDELIGASGGKVGLARAKRIATPGPYAPKGPGPYSHLSTNSTRANTGPGRSFTPGQRSLILAENMKRNGGKLVCDVTGKALTLAPGHPNSAQVDHIVPKSHGGTNDYSNAQLVCAWWNQSKGARFSGRRKKKTKRCMADAVS